MHYSSGVVITPHSGEHNSYSVCICLFAYTARSITDLNSVAPIMVIKILMSKAVGLVIRAIECSRLCYESKNRV